MIFLWFTELKKRWFSKYGDVKLPESDFPNGNTLFVNQTWQRSEFLMKKTYLVPGFSSDWYLWFLEGMQRMLFLAIFVFLQQLMVFQAFQCLWKPPMNLLAISTIHQSYPSSESPWFMAKSLQTMFIITFMSINLLQITFKSHMFSVLNLQIYLFLPGIYLLLSAPALKTPSMNVADPTHRVTGPMAAGWEAAATCPRPRMGIQPWKENIWGCP